MDSNYKKYYDIDTVAVIKGLLSRWYFLLSLAVLFAFVAYFVGRFCRSITSQNEELNPLVITEITTEEEAEQIRAMLSDDALKEIDICMDRVDRMQELKTYMNEAVLMRIDPYNCRRLTIEYEASSEQKATAKSIAFQYMDFVTSSESFLEAVNQAIGDSDGHYHVSDLIMAEEVGDVSGEKMSSVRVDFTIVLMDEWDEDAITDAAIKAIESYELVGALEGENGTFKFLKSFSAKKSFSDIHDLQTKMISRYNNDTSYLSTAIKNLDRPSALLYNYTLRQVGLEQDYKVNIADPEPEDLLDAEESRGIVGKIAEKSLIKVVILGFMGGIFVACGLMICYWLIRGKAGRKLGISVMSDRPLFGLLKMRSEKVENIDLLGLTADNLASFLHRIDANSVDIICVGKNGEKYEKIMQKLCNNLSDKGDIKAYSCYISSDDPYGYSVMKRIGENVVFCIAFEETTIKEIYLLEHQLTGANISVLGTVGIE